jgi:GrpB-like predicted nucleotidyltransferase (UPF0157 family)
MTTGIVIADYDPAWPRLYARERRRIRRALAGRIVAIEHVGSTSVPGLAAKPILDIMAGVESLDDAAACIEPLRRIGYDFHPELTARVGIDDDRLFLKGPRGIETVHLHVTEYGGGFWQEKLLFRDFLRTHPEVAEQYAALKRTLAPQFSEGTPYSMAKTEFVQATLEQARRASDSYSRR